MSGFMEGYIYFIVSKEMDAVKIGFTDGSPHKRMKQLQTGNPFPLELALVIDGDREFERAFHVFCADERLSGEWFTLSGKAGDLLSVLKRIYTQLDGTAGSVRWMA